jgi:hypothetical protein
MRINQFATLQRGDRVMIKSTRAPQHFTIVSEPHSGNTMIDGLADGTDGDGKVYGLYFRDVTLILRDAPAATLPNTTQQYAGEHGCRSYIADESRVCMAPETCVVNGRKYCDAHKPDPLETALSGFPDVNTHDAYYRGQ